MSISLHNTLTRRLEPFVPAHPPKVTMYICGPTVYNDLHIGNFRCFVLWDTLARFLRSEGYAVVRVQNFTDIDDKMIRRARELGITLEALAERYIARYREDAAVLGVAPADYEPRPTRHVEEIVRHIEGLIQRGVAYRTASGDVYFRVRAFPGYGELSHQSPEERQAGARVEPGEEKEAPEDFALWKAAKPGEPSWPSPFGPGRPGWHIECSVMSELYLGLPIDIHAGGADLIFPHHENERAQSEALHGTTFVRYWLHNAMLTFDGEKMSKSLGNVATVSHLRQRYPGQALRLFLLSAHYRTPLSFSEAQLEANRAAWQRIVNARARLAALAGTTQPTPDPAVAEARQTFRGHLAEDFHTENALSTLFSAIRDWNATPDETLAGGRAQAALEFLDEALTILGFPLPETDLLLDADVEARIRERAEARARRDWARADAIRQELLERGILLEDTPSGVRWRRV